MSSPQKCPNCGLWTTINEERSYKAVPISQSKRKQYLWMGIPALVIGILLGIARFNNASQEIPPGCVCSMVLILFGLISLVYWGVIKQERIHIHKYSCPLCKFTWEYKKDKEGLVESPVKLPIGTGKGFQVKVVDCRTEEEKQAAEEGSRGIGIGPEAETLMSLLTSAYEWGRNNRFPLHEGYPQYKQIRSIGKKINREGGLEAMQRTYYFVHAKNPTLGSLLGSFWHLIGDWRR